MNVYAIRCSLDEVKDDFHLKDMERCIDDAFYWFDSDACLHNWMEALFIQKGGEDIFDFIVVRLEEDDIDRLEEDVRSGAIRELDGSGFFFPKHIYSEKIKEDELRFVAEVRKNISDGYAVYYHSWRG